MKLKELREKNNISQRQIANDLDIKYTTYNGYERNMSEPDIKTLIKLADYFHTTIDHLVGHEVPYLINKSTFSSKQLELIESAQNLSNEQCEKLLAYLDGLKDRN